MLVCVSYSQILLNVFLDFFSMLFIFILLDGLVNDLHKVGFKSLFLKFKSVLVPDEIRHFGIPSVFLHAAFEQTKDILVIRILSELKFSTIVHKFFELFRVAFAKFVNSNLKLLLLDVTVLFVLGSARESLPGKGTS